MGGYIMLVQIVVILLYILFAARHSYIPQYACFQYTQLKGDVYGNFILSHCSDKKIFYSDNLSQ